jgi:hypothetical protein
MNALTMHSFKYLNECIALGMNGSTLVLKSLMTIFVFVSTCPVAKVFHEEIGDCCTPVWLILLPNKLLQLPSQFFIAQKMHKVVLQP